MIQRIHHIQITIPPGSEAIVRSFYCDFLGLTEVPKPDSLVGRGGLWVTLGDQQIHFGVEERAPESRRHIAFQVADLDFARKRLQESGITLLDGLPIPGFARIEFRDPVGNRLELIQPVFRENPAERGGNEL